MYILGVSCFYHDSAAVLLDNGDLVAAAEEERFSRKKHDNKFPRHAIDFCLSQAGIMGNDLDYVVFYEKPMVKFERILTTSLNTFPRSWKTFQEALITWFEKKLWIKSILMRETGVRVEKILFVDHHLAHAASCFFSSPFKDAAILTIDGVGEWTTTTLGYGCASWQDGGENEILRYQEQRFPHSIGLLYSAFTAYLGFRVNNGEYKVMGMSPYGEPRYMDEISKIIKLYGDGSFWLNMDYFSYHHSTERTFNQKFVDLFGSPRSPEGEFFTSKTNPDLNPNDHRVKENQRFADIAASVQRVTEEAILSMLNALYERTRVKRVCMAGGVTLNSKANGRILRETPFEELYIQPAAGDSGGALGAALYIYHAVLKQPRKFIQQHNYWGKSYPCDETRVFLDENDISYDQYEDDEIAEQVVMDIISGRIVGLYQGRFEWGPRALGNRSILADPRLAEMKEIVNDKIKFRESFRPFAPVVLEEKADQYFDYDSVGEQYPARAMLLVMPTKPGREEQIPSVSHMGTSRIQTIRKSWNPLYYRIVEQFGEVTGIPILLNTSFNLRGEPIVNSPQDAWNTFQNSGIDTLVLENYLVRK